MRQGRVLLFELPSGLMDLQRNVAATIGQQRQTNIARDKVVNSISNYRQNERIPRTTRQEYIELPFEFTFQACHSTQFVQ